MSAQPRIIFLRCPEISIAADFFGPFRDVLHSTFDNNLADLERVLASGHEGPLEVVLSDFHRAHEESRLVLSSLIRLLEELNASGHQISHRIA